MDVAACRLCLALDVRLVRLTGSALCQQYQDVTGLKVEWEDGLPQHVCWECSARLNNSWLFRSRCLQAEQILTELLLCHHQITEDEIKQINREENNLASTLSRKVIYLQECGTCVPVPEPIKKEEEQFGVSEEESNLYDDMFDVSEDDMPLLDISKMKVERRSSNRVKIKTELKIKTVKRETELVKIKAPAREREAVKVNKKRGPFNEEFATEILLTKEQQMEELKQRATTLNYLNSPYKCTKCYKGFVDDTAYKNHLTKHDLSSGAHECEVCRMRYTSLRCLRAHTISSHSRKYSCKICPYVAHTANQAREHDKWHKGYMYECNLCGEKFRKPTSHLTHMRKRHPTEFVCTVCGDSFIGRHGLMMHKQKTHKIPHVDDDGEDETPKAPERYCRECDVQFDSVEAWRRHTVTSAKHALNNDFGNGCRVCGDKFASREQLLAHSKRHIKRPPRDTDAASGDADFTITHVQCQECNAKFVNRSKCLAHVRRVHLGFKYNKNIVCELCGKKCTSNATLKYHQRTHTGERPYSCSECPKRFSDRNQLRIHTRTHTDERPYSCTLCQKTFRQKPALNRHVRVHTGAKPYECSYCGKTFSQSNSLKIHVHTVHLKLPAARHRNKTKAPEQTITDKTQEITAQRM